MATPPLPPALRAGALALALALSGCASTPLATTPTGSPGLNLPAAWRAPLPGTTASAASADRDAWQGFGDALLVQLVDEALAGNTDLQTAASTLARARALRDVAAAGQQLSLGSSGSAARNRSGGNTGSTLRAGLDASWEADLFGGNAAATRAAQADVDAAGATLQATRLSIAAETALAYVQWQGVRAQLAAARASLASQEQTLQLVRWKRQAGLAAELELQTALANTEQTRARVPALQQTLAQDEHALAVLLGQPPAALAERLAATPARQPEAPALATQALPAELLQRRPDLRAAVFRIESALATLAQKEAARKPSVTLSGSLGLQAATLSALTGSGALLAGLVASVNWPLLDGGAGAAQVAAQQASVDAAHIAWRAAVLAALQDVEDALVARDAAAQRVSSLGRASAAADEALTLARQRWQAGVTDFATLLDAERTALSAADSLASARTDFASAHIRLYKALGGSAGASTSTARP